LDKVQFESDDAGGGVGEFIAGGVTCNAIVVCLDVVEAYSHLEGCVTSANGHAGSCCVVGVQEPTTVQIVCTRQSGTGYLRIRNRGPASNLNIIRYAISACIGCPNGGCSCEAETKGTLVSNGCASGDVWDKANVAIALVSPKANVVKLPGQVSHCCSQSSCCGWESITGDETCARCVILKAARRSSQIFCLWSPVLSCQKAPLSAGGGVSRGDLD